MKIFDNRTAAVVNWGRRIAWTALFMISAVLTPGFTARAAEYYVDPATGSMSNPGTSDSPWSTLQAVFSANKTFAGGDVILLRTGYHGYPQIKGYNSDEVYIQPDTDAYPTVRKLTVRTAAQWVISGLDICPANVGTVAYDTGNLIEIQSSCSYITLQNCLIRGAESTADWAQADWAARLGTAVMVRGPYSTIANNYLLNVKFGIQVLKSAGNSLVSRNTIREFSNDGMRGLADYCTFEYNTVMNCHTSDANHDDGFQSWSRGADGSVGTGTVYNVTLRGNIFLSHTDPNQPFPGHMQGIGCFDGKFENWVIENNIVSSGTYHGIALYGAINCLIVNNTVVENPVDGYIARVPWIRVTSHKNGTPSTGNIVRNNLTSRVNCTAGIGAIDYNLESRDYGAYFVDYNNFDFSLLETAPAVDAGTTSDAPAIDIGERPRSEPYDVGAFEYVLPY
ncbi:MAG: right-handed parallel beta-helix repeat-containing protein [Verrucomicrobiota bacterium]|nr:right-handed parallel beta-helix repeat-containing protein [Verrucomicrobiota bacterium]